MRSAGKAVLAAGNTQSIQPIRRLEARARKDSTGSGGFMEFQRGPSLFDHARTAAVPSSISTLGCVAIFVGRALKKEPLIVYEDGLQTRDFVHINDVVAANMRVWKVMTRIFKRLTLAV